MDQDSSASRGISHSSQAVCLGLVQIVPEGFELFLELVVDNVDLGVVGDGAEGDVGHTLVDEPLADVAVGGHFRGGTAGKLGFLELAVAAVGENVVGIPRAHDAGAGQGQGDTGCVDGYPPPAPLFGHVAGGAGAAGGVQHQVPWVGGHQYQALYYLSG